MENDRKIEDILYCTPEEAGLPSAAVMEFLEKLREKKIPMHSVLLARYGKVFAEAYYSPWDSSRKHRMFSETKSLVSLAIGCLEAEGKLKLDDAIVDYFPEYVPQDAHPYLAQMTIRQMLMMQSCHKSTTFKEDLSKNWVESFFVTKPDHRAGSIFNYDTSASHTLAALVEKLSQKKLLEYLREKFLDAIGFQKDSYIIEDPFGVSMGGSGLMAYPMDLLRIGLLLLQKGEWKHKQLIPAAYLEAATSFQVPNVAKAPIREEAQGYGYQFWRLSRDGYMMYGMGGQLLLCFPKYDLLCVTTANTMRVSGGNQVIYDSFYETVLAALEGKRAFSDIDEESFAKYLSSLRLEAAEGRETPQEASLLERVNGVTYRLENGNALIQRVRFDFEPEKKEGCFCFFGEKGEQKLEFALCANKLCEFPLYRETCASSAAWIEGDSFYLTAELMGENIGGFWLQAAFLEDGITLFLNKNIEYCTGELNGFFSGYRL
ncbi:MAG: serine hydrolase [bacterium]|nr:serine hydrolase [bacterium]